MGLHARARNTNADWSRPGARQPSGSRLVPSALAYRTVYSRRERAAETVEQTRQIDCCHRKPR